MAEAAGAFYAVETAAQGALALAKGLTLSTAPLTATLHRIRAPSLPRSSHTLSVVKNHAYIFGGEIQPRTPVDNAMHMIILPSTGGVDVQESDYLRIEAVGTDAVQIPAARVGHTASVIGSKIYIFGGRGGKEMTALEERGRVWVFDTTNRKWSFLDPIPGSAYPAARSYHAAASSEAPAAPKVHANGADAAAPQDVDDHGTLFVHAGCLADGRTGDLWAFDISSRSWAEFASAPGVPRGGTSLTVVKDRVYRFGGFDGKKELGGQVDWLDLRAGTFADKGGQGEMALAASTEGWKSDVFVGENASGPMDRSVAGLVPVSTGQGRNYLLVYGGETTPSSAGHEGAGRFLGDFWTFQLKPEGNTAASWKDAIRGVGLGKETGERAMVECKVKDEKGVQVQERQTTPMGERGWFACDGLQDCSGLVVWGGLNEQNERLGDGWIITVE